MGGSDGTGKFRIVRCVTYKKSKINTVGYGIAVDAEGNVYVTGYTTVTDDVSYNAVWVIKYNRKGAVKWTEKFFSPSVNSEGKDIAADKYGNVYVSGYYSGVNKKKIFLFCITRA